MIRLATKLQIIANVLKIRKYACVAAVSAAGLGAVYYVTTMFMFPTHLAVSDIQHSVIIAILLMITTAILGGLNVALVAFKIKRNRMMNPASNTGAVLGGALSAFTPGCPACTAPLAVILGAVGGLAVFPMQGMELKLVSIGVLLFSIYWITRGLQDRGCCVIGKSA